MSKAYYNIYFKLIFWHKHEKFLAKKPVDMKVHGPSLNLSCASLIQIFELLFLNVVVTILQYYNNATDYNTAVQNHKILSSLLLTTYN